MTILAKVGSFNTGTGAAASTVAVTGVGFTPKALILWWTKSTTTGSTDETVAGSINFGIGFVADTTHRNCTTYQSEDASATTDSDTMFWSDAAVGVMTITGAVDGLLDLQSYDADGFTMVVDDQFTASYHISYLALGGTDITNVFAGTQATPAATGNAAVTGVGFAPSVLFNWTGRGETTGTRADNAAIGFGCAVSTSQRGTTAIHSVNGVEPYAKSYGYGSETLSLGSTGGAGSTNMLIRGDLVSFNADGFTINWINTAAPRSHGYLAIKGGNWAVGSLTTRTDGADIAVTGLGFTPAFGLFSSVGVAQSTVDVATGNAMLSVGAFDSVSSRVAQAIMEVDGVADSKTAYSVEHDEVYINFGTADAQVGLMDIKSVESAGFTCVMVDTDPSGAFVWYVTAGNTGWSNIAKINGVASSSISKVDGVAVASISKVNGIAV